MSTEAVAKHPALMAPTQDSQINGRLLLHDLRSPINIGMILRVAETFRFRVAIYDPSGVLDDPARSKTISDFACGALQRLGYARIGSAGELDALGRTGRLIGMTIEPPSVSLPEFDFRRSDIFTVGNEYDGLPADFVARCSLNVTIPMEDVWSPKPKSHSPIDPGRNRPVSNDGKPNLNAAMSAGILIYSAFQGLRG
ncbi:MAG: TrmH family RNA methyltransferase [Hyphomonadaceae bacterium]|nr:TrmH family RNA methyltransferase [Hyphomonadaceae bacterium]